MAGLLDALIRRAAPGGYQETPEEQYRKSVMSPDYLPETSGRNVLYGGIRGLLDATPAGLLDAAQAGLNRLPTAGGAFVRAITGRAQGPVDAGMGLLGMQGSGPGYEAGRAASGAAVSGIGLLGNQAGGQLPRGYARDESGAIVWHGSPHKFDKFDSSKIGTGEGAQAYGHGLYLAEAKDVARGYRDKLTTGISAGADGQAAYLLKMYKTPERALEAARAQMTPNLTGEARKFADDVIRVLENGSPNMGALYKVDLPDEQISRMLDWDKPLSQQPEAVQKAIEMYKGRDWFIRNRRISQHVGDEVVRNQRNPQFFAEAMRDYDVPGIRYLDGGSRGAGAGTSNFVVFPGNEGLLKILSRE